MFRCPDCCSSNIEFIGQRWEYAQGEEVAYITFRCIDCNEKSTWHLVNENSQEKSNS